MKSLFYGVAVVLTVSAAPVMAQTATSTSTSGSTSAANAAAGAQAGAIGIGGNNLSGNRTHFNSPRQPGAIGMAGLAASSGCLGSTSAGVGFIGGSVGLGSTWQDQRCNAREDARLLAAFGYREQALQILIANSPMVAQVMVPAGPAHVVSLQSGFQPVALNPSEHYVNGVRQVYRGGNGEAPSEKCASTLGLLQQQDAYLRAQVTGKRKPSTNRNVLLVQQNLKTGIANLAAVCPANVAKQAGDEVAARMLQIDQYVATGRWTGPVG